MYDGDSAIKFSFTAGKKDKSQYTLDSKFDFVVYIFSSSRYLK